MSIKASAKYQMVEYAKATAVFYAVCIIVFSILGASFGISVGTINGSSTGSEASSFIFLLVLGLCSFKETFGLLSQNGMSRRSMFWGHITAAVSLSAVVTVLDKLVFLVFKLTSGGNIVYMGMMEWVYPGVGPFAPILWLYAFALNLAVLSIGWFITIVFYRLNKVGKVLVGAGVPVLLTVGLPWVNYFLLDNALSGVLAKFFDWALGLSANRPLMGFVSFLVTGVLFCLFSWLLVRRAPLKNP